MKLSKTALQWIKFARTDLNMAKASLELSSEYKNGAAFFAQQSAEKIVKAYLTSKQVRTPKTHDMQLLVQEVAKIDPALSKKLSLNINLVRLMGFHYRIQLLALLPLRRSLSTGTRPS
jgi:HEPN domain-containing protein